MQLTPTQEARIAELLFGCGDPDLYTSFVSSMSRDGFEMLGRLRVIRLEEARQEVSEVRVGTPLAA